MSRWMPRWLFAWVLNESVMAHRFGVPYVMWRTIWIFFILVAVAVGVILLRDAARDLLPAEEEIGKRLRRECESIVREGGDAPTQAYFEYQVKQCIMRRGVR